MSENDISTAWALTWMLDVGPYGCSSALQRMKSVANRHCSKQEVKGRKATYRSRVFHTRESRTTTGKPRHRRLRDRACTAKNAVEARGWLRSCSSSARRQVTAVLPRTRGHAASLNSVRSGFQPVE